MFDRGFVNELSNGMHRGVNVLLGSGWHAVPVQQSNVVGEGCTMTGFPPKTSSLLSLLLPLPLSPPSASVLGDSGCAVAASLLSPVSTTTVLAAHGKNRAMPATV